MKKVFLLSLIVTLLTLTSCVATFPYSQHTTIINFSIFTEAGIFVTESNSVSFDYQPLGSIKSVVSSGYTVKNRKVTKDIDDVYTDHDKVKMDGYIEATLDDTIYEFIDSAKELNANGIINLKVDVIPPVYDKSGSIISPLSYVVSGMAIKR